MEVERIGGGGEARSTGNGAAQVDRRRACVRDYQFLPHPDLLKAFDFVPKLYGRGGVNMKKIVDQCEGKVRLRGRGSRHLEFGGLEARMKLKLYLSCTTQESLEMCHQMVLGLLERLESEFRSFCRNDTGIELIRKHGAFSKLFVCSKARGRGVGRKAQAPPKEVL